MLKPVTVQEKAEYTLKIQTAKATEELLADYYYSGYDGYVDIWPVIKTDKKTKQLVLEVKSKKITTTSKPTTSNSARYHIAQNKGVKMISGPKEDVKKE